METLIVDVPHCWKQLIDIPHLCALRPDEVHDARSLRPATDDPRPHRFERRVVEGRFSDGVRAELILQSHTCDYFVQARIYSEDTNQNSDDEYEFEDGEEWTFDAGAIYKVQLRLVN